MDDHHPVSDGLASATQHSSARPHQFGDDRGWIEHQDIPKIPKLCIKLRVAEDGPRSDPVQALLSLFPQASLAGRKRPAGRTPGSRNRRGDSLLFLLGVSASRIWWLKW